MKLILMTLSALTLIGGTAAAIGDFKGSTELSIFLFVMSGLFFIVTVIVEHRQVEAYRAKQQEAAIRAYEREIGLRQVDRVRRRSASGRHRGDLDSQMAHNQNALVTAAILADDDDHRDWRGPVDASSDAPSHHHDPVIDAPKSSGGFGGSSDWGGGSSFGGGGGGFSSSSDSGGGGF